MQHLMLLALWALFSMGPAGNEPSDQILGQWTNEDRSGVLEFVKNGSDFDAIVRKAPIPDYIGKTQIASLKFQKDNRYEGGTFYAFKKDKTLRCAATLYSANELELKLSKGPMTQKRILTRFHPEE
jgi:uncharacterized protein (DUF2147 family)